MLKLATVLTEKLTSHRCDIYDFLPPKVIKLSSCDCQRRCKSFREPRSGEGEKENAAAHLCTRTRAANRCIVRYRASDPHVLKIARQPERRKCATGCVCGGFQGGTPLPLTTLTTSSFISDSSSAEP